MNKHKHFESTTRTRCSVSLENAMQQCRCEHWQECPVCEPRRFNKDGERLPPEPTPLQDARTKLEAIESHAKRLALSLECLLLECKDIAAVSKWWDSSHITLTEYQAAIDLLYPQEHVSPLGAGICARGKE